MITQNLKKVLDYCQAQGYFLSTMPGTFNILYLEGVDPDLTLNSDRFDQWNDLRLVLDHNFNVVHSAEATTEPGKESTFSKQSAKLGGVARIAFGQHTAWKMGYHKRELSHPALVQVAPIPVHRDYNRDGIRPGDPITMDVVGLNQHGTHRRYKGSNVGDWSAGCLVGRDWMKHIDFIDLLRTDTRYKQNQDYVFSSIILPGNKVLG